MDHEQIREFCLAKADVKESLPFDEHTLVFKVGGKMFLLLSLDSNPPEFNVKCSPDKALELRAHYIQVKPGYHMNKTHWNTVTANNSLSNKLIEEWINDSYELIVAGLPKKTREKYILTKKNLPKSVKKKKIKKKNNGAEKK
jgi:predicted DNA-binding protein (MmcQ/YjbR family)